MIITFDTSALHCSMTVCPIKAAVSDGSIVNTGGSVIIIMYLVSKSCYEYIIVAVLSTILILIIIYIT